MVSEFLGDWPVIVDVDDLEAEKREGHTQMRLLEAQSQGASQRIRTRLEARLSRRVVTAWRKFDDRVIGSVDKAVVCSEEDVALLSHTNLSVVPNSYPKPLRPLGSCSVSDEPTLLMAGNLIYGPNVDAAHFFVHEVLPLIRDEMPNVRLRLVGKTGRDAEALHDPPAVTVTGYVPSIEAELAVADVSVVPIRYGGGTRIKILESFAHGIPVVSTAVGAHGLSAIDGQHLLLAEGAEEFALSCLRALRDEDLRARLIGEGGRHYARYFTEEAVLASVAKLAREVIGHSE